MPTMNDPFERYVYLISLCLRLIVCLIVLAAGIGFVVYHWLTGRHVPALIIAGIVSALMVYLRPPDDEIAVGLEWLDRIKQK